MGAGASSHDRFSPAEIAASVRELGAAYVQYGSLVEDNAVSGRVVARSLADGAGLDALLDDIGIAKRLHRDVITDLAHQHAATLSVARQQLSPAAREPNAAPAAPAPASPAVGNRHLWAGDAVAAALRWPEVEDPLSRPCRGYGGGAHGRVGSGGASVVWTRATGSVLQHRHCVRIGAGGDACRCVCGAWRRVR